MSYWLSYNEKYEVSLEGDVRHKKFQRVLKTHPDKDGYDKVVLPRSQNCRVARLVGTCFLPHPTEPIDTMVIDHIDRNKQNNHASNLRWVSRKVNQDNRSIMVRPASNSTSEEHHIFENKWGKFIVQFRRLGVYYRRSCETLEEAIKERNELIAEIEKKTRVLV